MRLDITYVGNSSYDFITTKNVNNNKNIGGSALYSSFASKVNTNIKIGIVSNVNYDLKKKLENMNILFFGNIIDNIINFKINEIYQECEGSNYGNYSLSKIKLKTNFLHVSFRRGINFEEVLENKMIEYNNLSVDVILHSVKSYITILKKYASKIKILFCNAIEYQLISNIIGVIPLVIVTNEYNHVVVITHTENISYPITRKKCIISSTGAGDSFIGGFFSRYVVDQNLNESVNMGIFCSNKSLDYLGAKNIKNYQEKKIRVLKIPNNIIVVGTSCSGKTTFIEYFKSMFNVYNEIDDLEPLTELFMMDDLIANKKFDEFKLLKDKILFIDSIWKEYNNDLTNIDSYTKCSDNGKGHDIIKPITWDYILKFAVKKLSRKNNIIQFSRGKDSKYENIFGNNVYERCFENIFEYIPNPQNTLIINLVSDLELRIVRNNDRYKKGKHYVSDETMRNVYAYDVFKYTKNSTNTGFIEVNKFKLPVFVLNNNKDLNFIERKKFFLYNIMQSIKYYNLTN